MRTPAITISSLVGNVLLAGFALYSCSHREASRPIPLSQSAPPLSRLTKTNAPATPFHWQQVESEDYKTFVANLRAIGCPEETIRDIVIADVSKLFATRERALLGTDDWKYWRADEPLPAKISQQRQALVASLREEKRALVRALLGIDLEEELAKYNAGASQMAYLDFLSAQKRAGVLAILDRFTEAKQKLYADSERRGVAPDWKQLKAAFAQREAELAQLLSSSELREYQLRKDETADNLRQNLIGFQPTEAEFQSLFQLLKPHEDNFSYADPADDSVPEQKSQDQAAVEAQIKTLLGDARYADYQRSRNPQFQELFRLTQQFDLPAETAAAIFDWHQQMQSQLGQLSSLTPDQRQDQLTRLQSELDSLLRSKLGEQAYAVFQARGLEYWLPN